MAGKAESTFWRPCVARGSLSRIHSSENREMHGRDHGAARACKRTSRKDLRSGFLTLTFTLARPAAMYPFYTDVPQRRPCCEENQPTDQKAKDSGIADEKGLPQPFSTACQSINLGIMNFPFYFCRRLNAQATATGNHGKTKANKG